MPNSSPREGRGNLPNHVFLVFSNSTIFYTPLYKLELELFRVVDLLLEKHIPYLTVFNTDGYLNDFFSSKYGKCVNKNLDLMDSKIPFSVKLKYLKETKLDLTDSNNTLMYFINRQNKQLFISSYNKDTHSRQNGLIMLVINQTHSHSKLLNLNKELISPKTDTNWFRERSKKGVTLEYQVPDESSVTHPKLQDKLCTFNNTKVCLPDLLISLRASLKDILIFLLCYTYLFFLSRLNTVVLRKPSLDNKCKFDQSLLKSALVKRIGNIFRADMSIIHCFGAGGIQPWFLSEAEMYEDFGVSVDKVSTRINQFTNTVRRWGK